MRLPEWKVYASKVRKKPKSSLHKYKRASAFRVSRKAGYSDCDEQGGEVQKEEEKEEMKLRPPIEVYEALDTAIETHLERVYGKETETGLGSPIQGSGSVSSEERGVEPSSSSSSDRPKKVRRKKNGQDSSSGPQAES